MFAGCLQCWTSVAFLPFCFTKNLNFIFALVTLAFALVNLPEFVFDVMPPTTFHICYRFYLPPLYPDNLTTSYPCVTYSDDLKRTKYVILTYITYLPLAFEYSMCDLNLKKAWFNGHRHDEHEPQTRELWRWRRLILTNGVHLVNGTEQHRWISLIWGRVVERWTKFD